MQSALPFNKATIHPTVLLGIVDHRNRNLAANQDGRLIGALVGRASRKVVDVTCSFGVPFEERPDDGIWVLDLDYVDDMLKMHRKINASESLVGWYQTGSNLKLNDIEINKRFRSLNNDIIAVVVDTSPKQTSFPTKAYVAVEEKHEDGRPTSEAFQHIDVEIVAEEAEEVGVEHLLRDLGTGMNYTVSQDVKAHYASLKALHEFINKISSYLSDLVDGKLPINCEILNQVQAITYQLPIITTKPLLNALKHHCNDYSITIYLSLLTRTVIALNNLLNNKIQTKSLEIHQNKDLTHLQNTTAVSTSINKEETQK